MNPPPQVVVVGAGIVGAAIALKLQTQGWRVVLLDRGTPGRGASFGNMACIAVTEFLPTSRPSTWRQLPRWLLDREGPVHVPPGALPGLTPWLLRFMKAGLPWHRRDLTRAGSLLCLRATHDFRALVARAHASDLVSSTEGVLRVYLDPRDEREDREYLSELDELGFGHRRLTRHEVRELEPSVSGSIHGGTLQPQWLLVKDPFAFTARVVDAFVSRGGIVQREDVKGFASEGRSIRALRLDSGRDLPAGQIVLACGAWTGRLTKQLHDPIPLETERGYHTQISNPGITLQRPLMVASQGYVISPVAGGIRVGGTVELGGLDAPPHYERARILVERARRLLPGLAVTERSEWMGHRPAFPDTIPIISRASRFENVYYATGHGHLGLTLAATTSELVSELVAGRTPSVSPAAFDVRRF